MTAIRNKSVYLVMLISLVLPFAAAIGASRAESFTLEESVAAHATLTLRSRDLTVPPGGRYVAWIEGTKLFSARSPDFVPRVLVALEAGESIRSAYASPDGEWLYYLRGSTTPAFAPHPAEDHREFWRVSASGGAAVRLAHGANVPSGTPVFAPNGQTFVTAEGTMLYQYSVAGDELQKQPLLRNDAQHYAAVRLTNLEFSPDGGKLAFVSWRKAGQSYVTILDLTTGDYQYIDAGIFRDVSPAWSPDGRQLVFVRMPGNWTRQYRFSPVNAGAPWSLLVVAAGSGKTRTIWRADEGAGSVFYPFSMGSWMEGAVEYKQLSWTASGQILFPWEKTGWVSLYAVSASGGVARQLTPGSGEITMPTLSADEHSVVYATNIDDIARLHLWRVSVNGGEPQRITTGAGVEHGAKLLADGSIVYIGNSNGRMPNTRRVMTATGRTIALTPEPDEARKHAHLWRQFVDQQVIAVTADDGVVSHHLVSVPRGEAPKGGFPVIVASKGGPNGRVSPGNGSDTAFGQYAVSRGYIFVDINYRGCYGFGLEYRLPAGRGATGGSEVHDLAALARYLRGRSDVDASRIGIMGGSYGGHIVGLALSRLPQYYVAGAHLSGVSDWVVEMRLDQLEGWPSAPPEFIRLSERMQIEDLAYQSSPPAHITAWRAPTLFTMGELDTSGHMQSIIDLGYRLMEQGTPVEFSIAPEAGHSGPRARPPERVFEFFERTLQAR